MLEPRYADPQAAMSAPLQIILIRERTVLRLKSWVTPPASDARRTLQGRELPPRVGATLPGSPRVLCLGPAEWLVVSDEGEGASCSERREFEMAAQGLALVDVSQGYASIALHGSAASDVVSKGGCGLDLHPSVFSPARCARTLLAQIPVVVECLEEQQFELHVARSYFPYLRSWLATAAAEFTDGC